MEKLPQNIQALIGEIGERQVLLRLYLLIRGTSWNVFHNLGEAGFDVLLMHSETGEKVCIEVKTRQRLYTTGKNSNQVHFVLTDGEYKACDFLVAYLLDSNDFYIVPKGALKRAMTKGNIRWRIVVTMNKAGEPHPRFEKYRNAWNSLHSDFLPNSKNHESKEFADPDYWPELEEAVLQQEAERSKIFRDLEAREFVRDLEAESEKIFWAQEIEESLGVNAEKMKALVEVWDPPVFAVVKQLAEACKLNTTWTIKTKIINSTENHLHSLCWEVLFARMTQNWYVVELELNQAYEPKRFRVECKQPGNWLQTESDLGALKKLLVEAYKQGKVFEKGRKERPGWVLREETSLRH